MEKDKTLTIKPTLESPNLEHCMHISASLLHDTYPSIS